MYFPNSTITHYWENGAPTVSKVLLIFDFQLWIYYLAVIWNVFMVTCHLLFSEVLGFLLYPNVNGINCKQPPKCKCNGTMILLSYYCYGWLFWGSVFRTAYSISLCVDASPLFSLPSYKKWEAHWSFGYRNRPEKGEATVPVSAIVRYAR